MTVSIPLQEQRKAYNGLENNSEAPINQHQ